MSFSQLNVKPQKNKPLFIGLIPTNFQWPYFELNTNLMWARQPPFTKMPKIFIDPILSLIPSLCGPGPQKKFTPFYMPILRESPPEDVPDMFKWFFPSLPKLPNLKLIVYLPKMFSPAGVPSWSCCPAHCWHSTELRTTHKWPVYWPQVRYTHEHTETHLTMGYEVSR